MINDGWIKTYRSIMDDELYFAEKFTRLQAWLDLLLTAEYKPRTVVIRGIKVEIGRGQLATSIRELAIRWRWGVNKVQDFLKELEASKKIDTQKSNVVSIISICKYEVYQDSEIDRAAETDTQTDTQIDTQTDTQSKEKVTKKKYNEEDKEDFALTPPDGDARANTKKSTSKRKSPEEYTIVTKGQKVLEEFFTKTYKETYTWSREDGALMKNLLGKIKSKRKARGLSLDDDSIVSAFGVFLDKIEDPWVLQHFSVGILVKNFNQLVIQAKAGKNIANGSNRYSNQSGAEQRMREGADIVARLLAEDDAKEAAGQS